MQPESLPVNGMGYSLIPLVSVSDASLGSPRFQQPLEPTSIPPVGGGLYNCVSLMSEPLPKVYFWGLRMISYPPPPQTTLKSV